MKYTDILSKMSVEEKLDLCCGADFWHSAAFDKYGIPAMTVADGPHGLRYQRQAEDMLGINESESATCFPTAAASGCSWDTELICEVGKAIADEASYYGVDTVLGPGINIKRSPLCGRNFEYYSEDPYLCGQLGAAFVKGIQKNGTGACIKHFAANSQEYKRFSSDSHVDERTLREIYFPAFEQAVVDAKPSTVMCAYNKINSTYCSDNKWLLSDVLRTEWGFEGMVVTDWGAMHDRIKGFKSGCDWSMPGGTSHLQKYALSAYKNGELTIEEIDVCADRILNRVFASAKTEKHKTPFDKKQHHNLAKKAAGECAVLLKNDGILPLKTDKTALIGYMAKYPRFQGSGSSHINPTFITSFYDAAQNPNYAPGCDEYGDTTDTLINEAVTIAKDAEIAIVTAGLPDSYESEGFDRADMRMPEGHIRLIEAVASANKNTVVVLICGSPVELPWLDKVRAVLYMGLPGQAGGEAIVDVLTGKVNPSGKLAETWPLRYEDSPCSEYYGEPHHDAEYREGIYVGYRYYETSNTAVRFPFGFGLSYTEFEYCDITTDGYNIRVTVKNTGNLSGAEIIQLYVSPPKMGIHRPVKELKRFAKVFLLPGESKTVEFILDERCFAVWADGWRIQKGTYEIQIAASASDIKLTSQITMDGIDIPVPKWQSGSWYAEPSGKPPKKDFDTMMGYPIAEHSTTRKGDFTTENTILEMAQYSLILRFVKYVMTKSVAKSNGGRVDYRNPTFRMMLSCSIDCPLFALTISSGGTMPENIARGLIDMANGHYLSGIKQMIKKQ